MSVADRDRLVFEEYADLSRHLTGVWRRERLRCLARRWCWCVVTGVARAGLSMVGVSPYEVDGAGLRADAAAGSGTDSPASSPAGSPADAQTGETDR